VNRQAEMANPTKCRDSLQAIVHYQIWCVPGKYGDSTPAGFALHQFTSSRDAAEPDE
jgi:hypothetical protein